jgi:hypothetical protein
MRVVTSCCLVLALGASTLAGQAKPSDRALVLTGVTVVDVRGGRLLPDQVVVVAANRIAAGPPAPSGRRAPHGRYRRRQSLRARREHGE